MSHDDYEFERTISREETATVLSGVADGVLAGSIRLGEDTDAVTVDVPDDLSLEIELETGGGELSLELELEWPAPDGASPTPPTETPPTETPPEQVDGDDTLVGAADTLQSLARFELFRDRREEWRWRLRHRNGNTIATSGEGYTRKHNALKGLRSVMENSPDADVNEDLPD